MRKRHSESGFTLVELSIVLVVVGLIIGSILVAVGIIQNARVTSTVNTLQSIQSAVSTYNQNYSAMPGDDAEAANRFGDLIVSNGGGDGKIGTTELFDSPPTTPSNGDGAYESLLVWKTLRAAGLIKGEASADTLPSNPFGGVFGIQDGAFGTTLQGNVLCMSGVPGDAARIIDQRLDDGSSQTGNVVGGTSIGSAPADVYTSGTTTIVCTNV